MAVNLIYADWFNHNKNLFKTKAYLKHKNQPKQVFTKIHADIVWE